MPPMECLDSVQSLLDSILLSQGFSPHILHFHSYYFYFELLLCYGLNVSPQKCVFRPGVVTETCNSSTDPRV